MCYILIRREEGSDVKKASGVTTAPANPASRGAAP